jgi:methyl-accepting chemotaxis protein
MTASNLRMKLLVAGGAVLAPLALALALWLIEGHGGFLVVSLALAAALLLAVLLLRPAPRAAALVAQRAEGASRELAQAREGVHAAARAMAHEVEGLARGGRDLSERTDSQASAIEQAAAGMEELTASVQRNTETARETQRVAGLAGEATSKGIDAATMVIAHMESIREATAEVSEIVGMIDAIAFQTNILALNAAVEAARAGGQGRGFAVVAAEVRALALRSAEAAHRIKDLVGSAAGRVTESTDVVDEVAEAIAAINARVAQMNELMNAIVSAGAEQSAGIGQVGQTITQMERATQQNAALVGELVAATGSLSAQSSRLAALVASSASTAGSVVVIEPRRDAEERRRLSRGVT